jgi:protein TonB
MKRDVSYERADAPAMRINMAAPFAFAVDSGARSHGEVLRLLLVPTIVTLLYVGGIFWFRAQLSAEPTGGGPNSAFQVHLLPRSATIAIPVDPISQTIAGNLASRVDVLANNADAGATDMTATKQAIAADPIPPGVRSAAAPIAPPPDGATAKFQQALLRHLDRYSEAAQAARMRGAVYALFSMRRDGTLLGAWVKVSSGHPMLDKQALDAIRRAQPWPKIPPELPEPYNVWVTLTFGPP